MHDRIAAVGGTLAVDSRPIARNAATRPRSGRLAGRSRTTATPRLTL